MKSSIFLHVKTSNFAGGHYINAVASDPRRRKLLFGMAIERIARKTAVNYRGQKRQVQYRTALRRVGVADEFVFAKDRRTNFAEK